jgi:hypothetical protein
VFWLEFIKHAEIDDGPARRSFSTRHNNWWQSLRGRQKQLVAEISDPVNNQQSAISN